MTVTLKVRGINTDNWDWSGLRITDTIGIKGDRATFTLRGDPLLSSNLPVVDQEVQITFFPPSGSTTVQTIFGGIIAEYSLLPATAGVYDYAVACVDYTRWLDKRRVSGFINQTNVRDAVRDILDQFTDGFSYLDNDGNESVRMSDVEIFPTSFALTTVSESLQEIADMKDAFWYVDFDKVVWFMKRLDTDNTAPIATISMTSPSVTNLTVSVTSDRKNVIIVKEFYIRSPYKTYEPPKTSSGTTPDYSQWESATASWPTAWRGTGSLTLFPLLQEPYDLSGFTVETSPDAAAWVSQKLEWEGTSTSAGEPGGTGTDIVYIEPEGRWLRFGTPPANLDYIRVSYRAVLRNQLPDITRDQASITEVSTRESTGGRTSDGVYEDIVSFPDIEFSGTTNDNVLENVSAHVRGIFTRWAWPRFSGKFTTYSDVATGWRSGQAFTLTDGAAWDVYDHQLATAEGVAPASAPLTCYVTQVDTTVVSTDILRYDITFSSQARPD